MRGLGQGGPFFVGLMVVFFLVKGTLIPIFSNVFSDEMLGLPLRALAASADAACERQAASGGFVGAGALDSGAPVVAGDPEPSGATGGVVIREEAIRIRILAHSDREEDQAVKRKVRDRVAALIASWPAPDTLAEARTTLRTHLAEIEAAAEAELARWGASYGAEAFLGDVPFPAKTFGGRTYPAGDYEALLITLGDGEGANWWCVLFPPLCLTGAVADDAAVAERPKETSGETSGAAQTGAAQTGGDTRQHDDARDDRAGQQLAPETEDVRDRGAGDAPGREADGSARPKVRFFLWDLLLRLWEGLKSLFS